MARITVEDCLDRVDNRFALIHLAAKRVRMLRKGADPLINAKNSDVVIALREIAAGKVFHIREGAAYQLPEAGVESEVVALPHAEVMEVIEEATSSSQEVIKEQRETPEDDA